MNMLVYPKYAKPVQHLKINHCSSPYHQTKELKSCDHLNRCRLKKKKKPEKIKHPFIAKSLRKLRI